MTSRFTYSFQPCSLGSSETCLTSLQNCIKDIRLWMKTNLLKLNDSKTEFLIVGTRQQLELGGELSTWIGNDIITPIPFVQNLESCEKLACSLYVTVRKISRVRYLVDQDTAKVLVQTL